MPNCFLILLVPRFMNFPDLQTHISGGREDWSRGKVQILPPYEVHKAITQHGANTMVVTIGRRLIREPPPDTSAVQTYQESDFNASILRDLRATGLKILVTKSLEIMTQTNTLPSCDEKCQKERRSALDREE